MKAAAQVVADAAARHSREGLVDDLALPGEAALTVVPPREHELNRCRMRKLGRRAEAAVAHVEQAGHLVRGAADEVGAHRAWLRLVEGLYHVLANRALVRGHALLLLAERACDLHQHAPEARSAVRIVVRWEVRPAEEHFTLGREERRERPATLSAQRLDGALIARVDVRPFVAVHLDAHEIAIQDLGDARILVGLAVHHVAPMAPDGADIEENRLLLRARPRERRG